VTEDERAELGRLRAENAQLKSKKAAGELTFKISEKGGLSVYGLGRFPVALYKEQWRKLLGKAEEIDTFLRENDTLVKSKDTKPASSALI
jgi:hypothetical protein